MLKTILGRFFLLFPKRGLSRLDIETVVELSKKSYLSSGEALRKTEEGKKNIQSKIKNLG